MRQGEYTRFDNMDYELFRTREDKYKIVLRTTHPSVSGFIKLGEGVFGKVIWDNNLITNAYYVQTYARYKDFDFQVESYVGQLYLLVTDSYEIYRRMNLEQRDRGVYQIYVDKTQIEKMWEVRSRSYFDLPLPEGLNEIEEVKLVN
jgi:hypothetical protein